MSSALTAPMPELTPELAKRLLDAAEAGLFLVTAAEAVGISPTLLEEWLRMGLSPGAVEPYRTFARAYRAREQGLQLDPIQTIRQHAQHDPKVAMQWLAMRWPDQWGPKATRNRQSSDLQPSDADAAAERAMVEQLIEARPPELEAMLLAKGWTPPAEAGKPKP